MLMVLSDKVELNPGDGIAELHWLTAEEVSKHPLVTDMAKSAINIVVDRGFDNLFPGDNEVSTKPQTGSMHLSLVAS